VTQLKARVAQLQEEKQELHSILLAVQGGAELGRGQQAPVHRQPLQQQQQHRHHEQQQKENRPELSHGDDSSSKPGASKGLLAGSSSTGARIALGKRAAEPSVEVLQQQQQQQQQLAFQGTAGHLAAGRQQVDTPWQKVAGGSNSSSGGSLPPGTRQVQQQQQQQPANRLVGGSAGPPGVLRQHQNMGGFGQATRIAPSFLQVRCFAKAQGQQPARLLLSSAKPGHMPRHNCYRVQQAATSSAGMPSHQLHPNCSTYSQHQRMQDDSYMAHKVPSSPLPNPAWAHHLPTPGRLLVHLLQAKPRLGSGGGAQKGITNFFARS
jgi:hypothetical protein